MTELEWLKQESGLTDDELKTYETILGDGKFKAMLKKVITSNDSLAAAKKTAETELEQFTTRYNSEFVPAMRDVTQQAITREGEVASLKAKLAKAKEFGLAIDDAPANAAVEPPRAPGSPDPNALTREDLNRFSSAQSNTILALQDLNAEPNFANFPTDHPLYLGVAAYEHLKDADLVLLVGGRAPWYPPHTKPTKGKIVSINENQFKGHMIYQQLHADAYLEGDIAAALQALTKSVRAAKIDAEP